MENIKNKFYLTLGDDAKEKYKILFENSIENHKRYSGFFEKESESKCKIEFSDKIDNTEDSVNSILKDFIELQKSDDEIDLSYVCFNDDVNFIEEDNYLFKIFEEASIINFQDIILNGETKKEATFIKEINFSSAVFKKEAIFRKCRFKSKITFEGIIFNNISNFRESIFEEETSFNSTLFKDISYFEQAIFNKSVNFESSIFKTFAYFEDVEFKLNSTFKDVVVEKMINFHNTKFNIIDFENSNFENVNFLGITNIDKKYLTTNNFKNKDSVRIIKSHFEMENNITEVNKYFIIEQEKYLEELNDNNKSEKNNNINKISLLFSKYVSNYGSDWVRVLIIMFGFGFLASLIYLLFDTNNSFKYINFKKEELIWQWIGLSLSFVLYYLYISTHKLLKLILFIVVMYYIQAMFIYANLQSLTNKIITLINPLNIFNQDMYLLNNLEKYQHYFININYFEDIALFGVILKGITITLLYQFIISFRNSSRRK